MANYLQGLASGLRTVAGGLNPQIMPSLIADDRAQAEAQERRRTMVAQRIIQAAESGAIPPEVARQHLQRLGVGDLPVGPSAETQTRMESSRRDREFRSEIEKLGPNPDPGAVASLATRFGKPELAVSMYNAQQANAQRAEAAANTLALRQESEQRQHEYRMGQLQRQQDRDAEIARHNQSMEALRQQGLSIRQALGAGQNKAPAGYRWKDDGSLEAIPGGPGDKPPKETGVAGETAGKVAMADQAVMDIRAARGILFDKDGNLDRVMIAAMNAPFTAGMPFNENARKAYSSIYNAIEAKLRIETGAAATAREVESIARRFLPKVSDSPNVVKERLDRLEQFMNTTLDQTKGVRSEALKSRGATPKTDDGWSVKEKK